MDRIRLVLLVSDETRAALRLEAAKQDREMSEVAEDLLAAGLADSLAEVRARKKSDEKRKPKS